MYEKIQVALPNETNHVFNIFHASSFLKVTSIISMCTFQ